MRSPSWSLGACSADGVRPSDTNQTWSAQPRSIVCGEDDVILHSRCLARLPTQYPTVRRRSALPKSRVAHDSPLSGRSVTRYFSRVGQGTLVVVILGLALIGFLHVTRGTAVRHVRGVATD